MSCSTGHHRWVAQPNSGLARFCELCGAKEETLLPPDGEHWGPYCTECGKPAVIRVSRGGNPFFGCLSFPDCRGSLSIEEGVKLAIRRQTSAIRADVTPLLQELARKVAAYETRVTSCETRINELEDRLFLLTNGMTNVKAQLTGLLNTERPMTEEKKNETAAVPAMDQLKSLGGIVGTGVAMGATDKVGDVFVKMALKMSNNSPLVQAALADPIGREIVKLIVATSARTTCLSAPHLVPGAEGIAKAADLQILFSSGKLTSLGLDMVGDELAMLAKIGREVAALPASTSSPGFAAMGASEPAKERA